MIVGEVERIRDQRTQENKVSYWGLSMPCFLHHTTVILKIPNLIYTIAFQKIPIA